MRERCIMLAGVLHDVSNCSSTSSTIVANRVGVNQGLAGYGKLIRKLRLLLRERQVEVEVEPESWSQSWANWSLCPYHACAPHT
jgi:hypothetical protein